MTEERLARTPLYDEHRALGARMMSFAGWEMPIEYTGIVDEHKAVRRAVGAFDVSHMGTIRVFGFGAYDYLQRLLTNDLARISELGSAQYTLLCDEDGGIIDDLIVYHTGELEYLIVANGGALQSDLDWLRSHVPAGTDLVAETAADRVADASMLELVDESDRTAIIALQGPGACAVVQELTGGAWKAPDRFHITEAVLDTVPALVARTGYSGEDGFELITHASLAAALWRVLMSFGEVTPAGLGARDTLRLEMGYPLSGQDLSRDVDPYTAGLGWAVALEKGPFVGRDALAAIRERGPAERLVGVVVGDGIPRPGFPVLHEGRVVGKVASGSYSPTLGTGIALAFVPAELAGEGTALEVSIRRRTVPAVVEKMPLVKTTSLSA